MAAITRNPSEVATSGHDVVILGGGIYGAMFLLEAASRGLDAVLLEREDFGGATSFNSLRIVHGGLRYLQTADLPRFFESVSERRWHLLAFPDLVRPLSCLMPLYGQGLRKPAVFRAALAANDVLSLTRNRGLGAGRELPGGRIIGPEATIAAFPRVRRDGLKGAARWHDAAVADSQRLIIEVLRAACDLGAHALNYCPAVRLEAQDGRVVGVVGADRMRGGETLFRAPTIINATGPWTRAIAGAFDRDRPSLFSHSLAWNVLFDREALAEHALAVAAPEPGAHTWFLHPWKGRLMIGTAHSPVEGPLDDVAIGDPQPSQRAIRDFLAELERAIPGLALKEREIQRIFSGFLPAADMDGRGLAKRPVFLDHGSSGGPVGLYSVSGVKLTTARRVARKCFARILGPAGRSPHAVTATLCAGAEERESRRSAWDFPVPSVAQLDSTRTLERLGSLMEEESVVHLDDLYLRRTTLWELGAQGHALAPGLCRHLGWDPARAAREMERLRIALGPRRVHHAARPPSTSQTSPFRSTARSSVRDD